jgi:hypothetical protein
MCQSTDSIWHVSQEQDPIFIDRFDGRALLDDRAKFIKLKGRRKEEGEGAEEAGLDRDRYTDLPGYIPPPTAQDMTAGTTPPESFCDKLLL